MYGEHKGLFTNRITELSELAIVMDMPDKIYNPRITFCESAELCFK